MNSTKKNNIVLIGFMGSGKTTVGRKLSKSSNMILIDTDWLIELSEGITIQKIFAKRGEEYFREKERGIHNWLAKNVNNAIISTGGGYPMRNDVKALGKVVHLDNSLASIKEKMSDKGIKKRPLFQDDEQLKALFEERHPLYRDNCHISIDATANTKTIISLLSKFI